LYYGNEIGMKNSVRPDAKDRGDLKVREDFPGGWPSDTRSAFTATGRTPAENDLYDYTKKLLAYRKAHPEVQTGKLMQFVPQDGQYTYIRYDDAGHATLIVMNGTAKESTVKLARFTEILKNYQSGQDVISSEVVTNLTGALALPAWGVRVLELKK
jgi:neopullulanase